jgi:hypothetical protein
LALPFPIEKAPTKKIAGINGGVKISKLLNYPVRGLVFEGGHTLDDLSNTVSEACICLQHNNIPYNVLISDCGRRVFLLPQVNWLSSLSLNKILIRVRLAIIHNVEKCSLKRNQRHKQTFMSPMLSISAKK